MRLPVIDGRYSKLNFPQNQVPTARIARPNLSKDIFEFRSAHARTPSFEHTHIFDLENGLVGRRIPFNSALSEIPEREDRVFEGSLLSVGRVPGPTAGVARVSVSEAGREQSSSSSWVMGAGFPLPLWCFSSFLNVAFPIEWTYMVGLAQHHRVSA